MTYQQVTIYVDSKKLTRQARAWARKVERMSGAIISRPVSAYLRHLIYRDAKRPGR